MAKINENFIKIPATYLFSEIAKRVANHKEANPDAPIIRMGIGDVSLPLPDAAVDAMIKAADEQRSASMYYMLLPILLMVVLVFFFLYMTGEGDILKGSGSSAIFYTMVTTLIFTLFYFLYASTGDYSLPAKFCCRLATSYFPV